MRRLAALVFVSLAVVGTGATAGPAAPPAVDPGAPAQRVAPDLRDRFAAALAMLRSGDHGQAARELSDPVWASSPLSDYASLFQAQTSLRAGDAAAARAAAARALDAAPDARPTPSFLLEAAAVLSGANDDAGAAAAYRRFLERYPIHVAAPRARYALALSLLAGGRLAEASREFADLWLLAPASPLAEDAGRQLRVLEERGLGGPAPTAKQAVERAERLLAAGMLDAARAEAEALIDKHLAADLQSRALNVSASASRRAGRHDAALATVNRALAELPSERRPSWLLELAGLQQRRSRDAALPVIDRLVREYPKSSEAAEALGMKGRLLEGAARYADAAAVYVKLVSDQPDHEEAAIALWRLGWLAWFRGSYAEAAQQWERLAVAKVGQSHREAVTYWIARTHEQRGQMETAGRQFAQLRAEAPRSYYGILAAARSGAAGPQRPTATAAFTLPADPREALLGDVRFGRIEALRAAGLGDFADEEMDEVARRSLSEPVRLYAVSAAYAQDSRYHLALRILRRHFQPYARSGAAGLPRAFWEIFYPLGWRAELTDAAGRAAVDPLLVAAVVREESSFYPQARSPVGARGLMQLMPETARPMARARRLSFNSGDVLDDPGANLDMGAAFLSGLLRDFGDARLAAAAYNAGPTRVREWWMARRSDDLEVFVEQIPYNETRGFVKRVMLSWEEYRRLYGAAVSAEPPAAARP